MRRCGNRSNSRHGGHRIYLLCPRATPLLSIVGGLLAVVRAPRITPVTEKTQFVNADTTGSAARVNLKIRPEAQIFPLTPALTHVNLCGPPTTAQDVVAAVGAHGGAGRSRQHPRGALGGSNNHKDRTQAERPRDRPRMGRRGKTR